MPVDVSIDPALVERFQHDWFALTQSACADRALVALSGGPDSTALLLLMHAITPGINPPIAATVDHGLRTSSAAEARFAADLCGSFGVPHTILRGKLPTRVAATANVSARARAFRYALLTKHAEKTGARWIITAHHAEDQLETIVMRLNRGSGVRGLSGIRAVQNRIVRPLLGWSRDDLAAIVTAAGIVPVSDPSNVDDRFDRARLRKQLDGADWLDAGMVARSASASADADAAIEWAVDRIEPDVVRITRDVVTMDPWLLPTEIKRRLVERCLRVVDTRIALRGGEISNLIAALDRGREATLGAVAVHSTGPRPDPLTMDTWVFRPAPPRRPT